MFRAQSIQTDYRFKPDTTDGGGRVELEVHRPDLVLTNGDIRQFQAHRNCCPDYLAVCGRRVLNCSASTVFLAIYITIMLVLFVRDDHPLLLIWAQLPVYFFHEFEEDVLPGG
jgi:hypothetical protein